MSETPNTTPITIETMVKDILATIEREREREIVSRRFGLFDRKETLEQIGELLGITRERVRQLEKSVVMKLKAAAEKDLPHVKEIEKQILDQLVAAGNVSRVNQLTEKLTKDTDKLSQSRISFLANLCPKLIVIEDNDHFYHSVAIKSAHDDKALRDKVAKIIDAIKKLAEPSKIETIAEVVNIKDTKHVAALASTSKHLATLNNIWGLIKWPTVNPKNIRDKIYVILHVHGKPLHFNEISKAIKGSEFKRKDVTTQAIHNELIKDGRFVLIGRGIYALKEWGYAKGTVADIITDVLKKADEPLHRDEIVKRVLKSRQVKETTILLNLQGKSQFKRVAKATYALAS
jgi:hypothetical protein